MQQFHKFITWRLCVAQRVSGASSPIIRSNTTALTASGFIVGSGDCSVVGRGMPDHDQQRCLVLNYWAILDLYNAKVDTHKIR